MTAFTLFLGLTIPLKLHLPRRLHCRVLPTRMTVMMPSASSENGGWAEDHYSEAIWNNGQLEIRLGVL